MASASRPSQPHSHSTMTLPHPRLPARTTTIDHEGWVRLQQQRQEPAIESSLVVGYVACPPPPKLSPPSVLSAHSSWQTDIVTFGSQTARDPLLRRAHVTEIQNRKSRKLPHLQEYLLVLFSAGQREFVARVDLACRSWFRGDVKRPEVGVPFSGLGQVSRHQVTVYRVEGGATPWFDDDGSRGSELIAALSTWSSLGASGMTLVSHHLSTARETSSGGPKLSDVCRLIEAVVLESPSHYFKTASSHITCRSTLLTVHTCFPHDFACSVGEERRLVSVSTLEEPAWSNLLRWYLPFTSVALVAYVIAVIAIHIWVGRMLASNGNTQRRMDGLEAAKKCMRDPAAPECLLLEATESVWKNALRLMLHLALDLPFPIGLLHTWLMSIEMQTNKLVKGISARFLNEQWDSSDETTVRTWLGTFSRPWFNFVVGSFLGCFVGLVLFLGILLGHGVIVLLLFVFCIVLWVNYMLPSLDEGEPTSEQPDDGLPLVDCESPVVRISESESGAPPGAGPSSSRHS
ncbi:Transmembrane protein [Ceratobasidium theobromae]|uniref:Transmembrane protein n=1 Tax=Ceratobasidium theobromae TaxID=1582974 RepID=A0A5N5QFW9_9AGAM|nr:Transmembrane protein [Ceratobasidium theobromae]